MIAVGNEFVVDIEDAGLDIAPSMANEAVPDWSGALWVGAVDLESLAGYTHLRLQDSKGYHRARLLVRSGPSVRGFVDVDAPGGVVDREDLETAASALLTAVAQQESSTPSITVIVCTRDRVSQLRGAIGAILGLDYPNFDVIIVDNAASADETRELVRNEFPDPRLTLISEPRPGLSRARNAGMYRAGGDIVAFTDDDVVVDRYWLRGIAAGFEQAPDVACVTGLVPAKRIAVARAGLLRRPRQLVQNRRTKSLLHGGSAKPTCRHFRFARELSARERTSRWIGVPPWRWEPLTRR
ncbi:glycosyltransferase family A protein [Pseudarthrobacter sp. So.54]